MDLEEDGWFPLFLTKGQVVAIDGDYFELSESATFQTASEIVSYTRKQRLPSSTTPRNSFCVRVLSAEHERPCPFDRSAGGTGVRDFFRFLVSGRGRIRCRFTWPQ